VPDLCIDRQIVGVPVRKKLRRQVIVSELLQLFERQPEQSLQARETLFKQGAPVRHVFLLVRGRLRMVRHLAGGRAVSLHTAGAGELFAEGALFSKRYQCDAVADEACTVKRVGKPQLQRAIEASPRLALELLERVTRQLHRARTLIELRNIKSANERVLEHLRSLLPPGSDRIEFAQPLLVVAAEIGLSHETYYRCLAELVRNGRITRDGRRIRILR
jgi:CRP/FNR family transcriptional regulator, dissimilatory nitrate respiration regulator